MRSPLRFSWSAPALSAAWPNSDLPSLLSVIPEMQPMTLGSPFSGTLDIFFAGQFCTKLAHFFVEGFKPTITLVG